ncbi:hypothetical protein B6N60_01567 [Richelia sinica FACHB-800]|uniref:Uncharacterized protein n=1 Tax=Richelia sinica FACHB-800 TaxID=1357546 RepID=A0A975T6M3_9NOST|nr:hypothetical protein B6N60_01567 [Richelia sinica FACHB-800]
MRNKFAQQLIKGFAALFNQRQSHHPTQRTAKSLEKITFRIL